MSPLPLFERTLTIITATTTHTITIAVIATIATVSLAVSFMKDVIVVVVVVVVEIVEVDVQADNAIDPEESVNMWSFFALEFTQETPQSI